MAPPTYGDLGKKANDVFNKGYHFGLWKLDFKTKTSNGVELNTSGHSNQDTGKVFGSLETKYKLKEYGLTFSEKWNTDNTLASEVSLEHEKMAGIKLSFDGTFAPQTGSKNGAFKTSFSHEHVRLDGKVNIDLAGPIINASAVTEYQGWLAGYQLAFDSQKNKLTGNNFAIGYTTGDFVLHTSVNDGREFGGSIYNRCNDNLETGVQLSWASGSNATKFGIAAKYDLDKLSSIRGKVNNASQIGLGYQHQLRKGVILTLSTLIDGKNFNAGGHKVGLALELEP